MKEVGRKVKYILILLIAVLSFFFQTGGGALYRTAVSARAATDSSSVIKDLSADKNFNFADYPEISDDYSIKVVQIAESEKGYLYVYTYTPCQKNRKLTATDINMSLTETADGMQLYELLEVNTWGVFSKYLVRDAKVSSAATRYYNISSIYRKWDNQIDGEIDNNNTGEKKAYSVANIYKVQDENGGKVYSCEPTYVVNILNPYSDFLIYPTSASLPAIPSMKHSFEQLGILDAHYIAFSTDLEIDRLMSATVTYSVRTAQSEASSYNFLWWEFPLSGEINYSKEEVRYAYPTYTDKAEHSGSSWTGNKFKYSWDRIQTVPEFISAEKNLTSETKQNLDGKQWVLRFTETERTQTERSTFGYKTYEVNWTEVKKVAVLRLEFETDGKVYNLGAVSDMVSGDDFAGNAEKVEKEKNWFEKFVDFFKNLWNKVKGFFTTHSWWEILLIILAIFAGIVLVVALVIAIIKFGIIAVLKAILWFFKMLFKAVWWLICLPFRGIAALINRNKDGKGGSKKK